MLKKWFGKKKKKRPLYDETLLRELARTKCMLESAYSNFQNVVDPDLIDCYIYEVNAAQQRYQFLLKQLKGDSAQKVKAEIT